jgi:ribonuclease HI
MNVYCDSSIREACVVVEGQEPTIIPYDKVVTNNVGEYKAVIEALNIARNRHLNQVVIYTDSLLVVNQVSGEWKCRKPHLLPFRDQVRSFLATRGAKLRWCPREDNLAGLVFDG